MTARSKGRREKNRKLKSEKHKLKELKRLQKTVASGKEMMEICSSVVDEKKFEDMKKKKLEETVKIEFVEEQREIIEKLSEKRKKKKITVVNENTGKTHLFDPKSLKDQHGSYPPWLNVGNHKRKIKRKKSALKRTQFRNGSIHF